jgi:O-antigen ligase
LAQFLRKYQDAQRAGADFYFTYVGHRITGFESHWMTFGALQLAMLSLVIAHWCFSQERFPAWVYVVSCAVFGLAIMLGWTRSIWLAAVPATLYLVWCWRPKMTLLVPVVAAVSFAAAPAGTKQRLLSLLEPHGETDSNRHRVVTFRTGVEMIKAHPVLGIGPEEIGRQFNEYVPSDIQRPLPVGYYGHLHNIYLQYAAERGVPGLLMVLWFVAWTLVDCARAIRIARRPSLELFVLHGAIAVIIGVLVGGCFEYNLGDSEVLMMFVCVVALAYAAVYRLRGRNDDQATALRLTGSAARA